MALPLQLERQILLVIHIIAAPRVLVGFPRNIRRALRQRTRAYELKRVTQFGKFDVHDAPYTDGKPDVVFECAGNCAPIDAHLALSIRRMPLRFLMLISVRACYAAANASYTGRLP